MQISQSLTVVALVFIQQKGKILLVQQDYGPCYWSLPGGVVERGESLVEAALREVREETGLNIAITRLVGIYTMVNEGALAVTFEGRRLDGNPKAQNEIKALGFFLPIDLPSPTREHLHQRVQDFLSNRQSAYFRSQ